MYDIIYIVLVSCAIVFASLKFAHMLQLESYQGKMYLKWVGKHFSGDFVPFIMVGIIAIALKSCYVLFYYTYYTFSDVMWYASDAVYIIMLLLIGFGNAKKSQKKPLKFTHRIIRLLIVLGIIVVPFAYSLFLTIDVSAWPGFILMHTLRFLPGILLPLFVLLAYMITYPLEMLIQRRYMNDAKKKLQARHDLDVIAITGSFGKTSTKFILGEMLNKSHNAFVTPNSFNTPMGVTRAIREGLSSENRAFVCEMGARYKGDVSKLCSIVSPEYGIITEVGKQHLETFKTLEGVAKTKGELLDGLCGKRIAVLNGDNELIRGMDCVGVTKLYFGAASGELYMRAGEIKNSCDGGSFTLTCDDGETVECTTRLLGKHNVMNITAAAAMAHVLGVSMADIREVIANLSPVEHRLQLIPGPLTVIDDAFNSNIEGFKYAMDVLNTFAGKKIVITPGMVELGTHNEQLGMEAGGYMADKVSVCVLIGQKQTEHILKGLLEAGFEESNAHVVESLDAASELLKTIAAPGDVVLFENDLPDNYNK